MSSEPFKDRLEATFDGSVPLDDDPLALDIAETVPEANAEARALDFHHDLKRRVRRRIYTERHGVAPPKGFDVMLTETPGLWILRRDGEEVGSIAFIPDAIALPRMHVQRMLDALNAAPSNDRPKPETEQRP